MSSIEGFAAVGSEQSQSVGTTPTPRAGETEFDALLQQVQFDANANSQPPALASPPPASAGGAPALNASEARQVTVRASDPTITERISGRIDTLNDSRLFERGARAPTSAPSAYSIGAESRPDGPIAALGGSVAKTDPFEAAVQNLQGAFHHAIEVEMVAKTGTSLNSSMNKLMSGQ